MNWWINLESVFFERFLAAIFPPDEVVFKLQATKNHQRHQRVQSRPFSDTNLRHFNDL